MLESELFNLLQHTSDAAFSVTEEDEIVSWNRAVEKLFGHPAAGWSTRRVTKYWRIWGPWAHVSAISAAVWPNVLAVILRS